MFVALQQQVDPTALGLRTVLARYNFLVSLLLLNDVLSAVNRLSVVFQRSTLDLSPLLNSTISSLESLQRESATDFEGKVRDKTTIEVNSLRCNAASTRSDSDEEEIESQFELVKIRANEPEKFEEAVRQTFLTEVIKNLHDRFPQVEVLEAFSIFDPQGLLGQDSLATEKLEVLLDQYQSLTKGPEGRTGCVDEYVSFVSFVKDHALLKTCQSMQQLALEFLTKDTCTQLFPTVSKLLVHALILPDCERCFSAMNRRKTDYRNRMHTATLDRLLRVKIEGPSLQDFNFREGVARWSKAKKRRLFGN